MSVKYSVHITRLAYGQLKEIRRYIAEELSSPVSARNLLQEIRASISSLQTMPSRHQLVEEEPWHTEGIRRLIVKNFYVYYWVNKAAKQVHIIAVVYGRRDQTQSLENIDVE